MNTRALESKDVTRATVADMTVEETTDRSVILRTRAIARDAPAMGGVSAGGHTRDGRLRIDAVTESMFRLRYAEGDVVPENSTPMVVGEFPEAPDVRIATDRRTVGVTTPAARLRVHLRRASIDVTGADGAPLTTIGGPERNHFGRWDAYNTGVCVTADETPLATECFRLSPQEAVYGFGETFIRLNKTGQTIDLTMQESTGVTTPRSYKNIPFFVSTRGYGVFFNHSSLMTAWVGSMSATDIQIAAEDDFLDYYLFVGDIKDVLAAYAAVTGAAPLPPRWSFGFWQSKISYKSQEEVMTVAHKLREHDIPCDVIHIDTNWFQDDWVCDYQFAPDRYPDPEKMFADLAQMGFKVSLWQLPYIVEGSEVFAELAAVDGFVKDADGRLHAGPFSPFNVLPVQDRRVGCIDFTNPAAVVVYQKWLRRLFDMGARIIKVDFGEDAPLDGVYHDGTPGHQMHNRYPLLYNQAVADVTAEATGDHIIWARSAWAGSQRYPVHWGGDNSPNFDNMMPQLAGGLSFGLSGCPFWSQDIGGFMGVTTDTLLVRWMQWSMFLSHARIHGAGRRELYRFTPETVEICRAYIRLRYRLLPYLYGTARECAATSAPFARALVVEYQDDPNTWNIGDQFLCGRFLLVAPIYDESNRRAVYLPRGVWTDWWTGERIAGPQWIAREADSETLPLYVREGGLIPMGPEMSYVGEKEIDAMTLKLAPFEGDGVTDFTAAVDDDWVSLRYEARAGAHTVHVAGADVPIHVDVLGADTPVRVARTGEA